MWLGEVESLICTFYLSVAAPRIVWADPSLRYTSTLLGRKATNQPTNKRPVSRHGGDPAVEMKTASSRRLKITKHRVRREQRGWVNRLVGLVVKAPASRAGDPGFESCLRRDFSGSSHTGDLKIGTPVATLPGAWHYRVSTGTGRPGVSIQWLGEVERLICNFYLSVAARQIVWADPSLRYTIACCWDVKQPTNKQTSGWV